MSNQQQPWGQQPPKPLGLPQQAAAPQYGPQLPSPQPPYGQPQGFQPQGFQPQGFQAPASGPQLGYGLGQPGGAGGVPPSPPERNGSGKILSLILIPLVLLALVGGGFAMLRDKGDEIPTPPAPTINPSTPSRPASTVPSSKPTSSSSTSSRPSSSTSASNKPSSTKPTSASSTSAAPTKAPGQGRVTEVAEGVAFRMPEGWSVKEQSDGELMISDGDNLILLQVFPGQKGTKAAVMVDSWLEKQKSRFQNAKTRATAPVTLKPAPTKAYNAADAGLSGTMTTQSGSADVLMYTVVFVREDDGVALAVTELSDIADAKLTDEAFVHVASDAATTLLD